MSLRLFSFSAFTCCSWSGRKSEKGEEGMSQWLDYDCSKSLWSSAKCCCFTVHLLSALCSLGLEVWVGFLCFAQGPQSDVQTLCWTCTQYSKKWPHVPLCLIFVALVSSGVMKGQSYPAPPVITGSWHYVSTVAKSCTKRQSKGSFLPRTREELLFNFLDFRAAKMAKSVVARWWLSPLDQKSLNNPKDNDDITII